jgi:hypothetical protein
MKSKRNLIERLRPFSVPKMAGFASQTPKDAPLLSVAFLPLWFCAAGQLIERKLNFKKQT